MKSVAKATLMFNGLTNSGQPPLTPGGGREVYGHQTHGIEVEVQDDGTDTEGSEPHKRHGMFRAIVLHVDVTMRIWSLLLHLGCVIILTVMMFTGL